MKGGGQPSLSGVRSPPAEKINTKHAATERAGPLAHRKERMKEENDLWNRFGPG